MSPRSIATVLILLLLCSSPQQRLFAQQNPGAASFANPANPANISRNAAGTVDWLSGSVQISTPASANGTNGTNSAASTRTAKTGDTLYEGDTMATAANSEAHLNMADGGFMALRQGTQLLVSKYQANGDSADTSVMRLLQGALRSVTGWIGKTSPKSYSIRTATATIGVRGTEHETVVVTSGDASEHGTYDRVYEGATTLSTPEGSVDVGRDKAGFVPAAAAAGGARLRPRLMAQVPQRFFTRGLRDTHFVGLHARLTAQVFKRRELRRDLVRAMRAERRGQGAQHRLEPTGTQALPPPMRAQDAPLQASSQGNVPGDAPARSLREQRMAERERRQALRQQQTAPPTGN